MKPRTLLILFCILLGLGAFIWFYERKLPSSDERAEIAKKVVPVKKDDVQGVTLETASGKVVLQRTDAPAADTKKKDKDKKDKKDGEALDEAQGQPASAWTLTQPMQARADAFAVDGLLDALTGLQKTRTFDGKVDRAAVGLDKPRATVRLKTAKGETVLLLGAEVPTGGELIAAVGDDTYVVADSILTQVDKDPGSWRDRQLFRAGRDAISRITLTGPPGGPVVLAQQNGIFQLERPLADHADRETTDDLYADLSGLTAEKFIDDAGSKAHPLADLGLQSPRAVVDVAFAKGDPVRIEIGGPTGPADASTPAPGQPPGQPPGAPGAQPAIYARIGSQVFETRTRLATTAVRPPADWRARGLSALEVYQVEAATVHDDKGSFRLTRAGTDWKRGEQTISYVPVSDFLFAVTGAKADRLLTAAESVALGANLAKPALTVDLEPKDGAKETLLLYPPVAAGTPARAGGRDIVLLLPSDKLKEIQGKLDEVKNAKPLK
ncbi:MAG TPA: DUF4340 domain-containing protein [Thermoanaerobaculia bacterium]|jgi:hypothetical protein|nr:DUF4340 domain-containing protein [Thermoanaerobaculia bacterium]